MQATTLYDRELERFVVQTRRETNKLAGTDRVFEVASLSRSEVAADIQLIASGAQELRRQALGAGAASNGRKGLERAKSGQTRRYGQAAEPNKPNSEKNKPKTIKVMDTQMTEIKEVLDAKPLTEDEAWGTLSPSQGEEPAADMEEAVANGNGHAEEAPAATTNGNAGGEEDSAPEDADRAEAPVDTDAMETDAAKAT